MIIDYLSGAQVRAAAVTAAVCLCAVPLSAKSATVDFDEFTNAQEDISVGDGSSSTVLQTAPTAQGDTREVMVENLAGAGDTSVQINGNGFLSFNNDSETTGIAMVTYDDEGVGLDLDITGLGMNDRILIDVIVIDVGFSPDVEPSFIVGLELTNFGDDVDTSIFASQTFTEDTADDIVFVFSMDFGDISGFNFMDVDRIKLTLDATNAPSADATLDLVGAVAVPLPASALLMLSALGGLGYVGSRRRG